MRTDFDIAYSAEHQDWRKLDLFVPENGANGCGILFVHGGGWTGGRRAQWHPVAEHFCRLGYVCASAGYRLAPATRFPGQIEDVRLAMAWLRGRADGLGIGASRIAAAGSSAGGHLVALLATIRAGDPLGDTPELDAKDTRPNAAVCYCPVVTVHAAPQLSEYILHLLGKSESDDPALYRAASPIDRVAGGEPPFLFLQGDADDVTPAEQTRAMAEALRSHGSQAEFVLLPGVEHGFGYGVRTEPQRQAVGHIERFLARFF